MSEKLRAEYPGILAWCVRGCQAWQAHGLAEPEKVTEATDKYRREQDILGRFLAEEMLKVPGGRAKAGHTYARYCKWAEAGNEYVMSQTAFGLAMEERGIEKYESHGFWYRDIGLRAQESETKSKQSDSES
jgi:putative DNA primase/helicase